MYVNKIFFLFILYDSKKIINDFSCTLYIQYELLYICFENLYFFLQNKKRKQTELEEAVSELSHAQIDSVWSRLHFWVDHQLTLLAAEDNQEQDDATKEQGSNVSVEQEQGDEHGKKSGTTEGVEEDGDSRGQEGGEEKTQEKENGSQRELRKRGSRNGSNDKVYTSTLKLVCSLNVLTDSVCILFYSGCC